MKTYHYAMARAFNTPVLLHPTYAQMLQNVLLQRVGADQFGISDADKAQFKAFFDDDDDDRSVPSDDDRHTAFGRAPFRGFTEWYMRDGFDGIGILPIDGTLTHNGPMGMASLGRTYKAIQDDYAAMLSDPAVKGIALMVNSPGGEVTGISQVANFIHENKEKPVWNLSNERQYSGGHWIGSQADKSFVTHSSGVGSVGVVMTLFNYQKQLEAQGVEVEFIQSGKLKTLGNSMEPMTDRDRQILQDESDDIWEQFIEASARNNDNMSAGQIRATEAGTFMGKKAVDIGFAEGLVSTEDEFLANFKSHIERGSSPAKSSSSTTKSTSNQTSSATAQSTTEEQEMNPEEIQAAIDKARTEGMQDGIQAAADHAARMTAVLTSDIVVEGRYAKAMEFLNNPEMAAMSADTLLSVLGSMPVEKVAGASEEDGEPLGDDAKALLKAAQKNEGTPDISSRGEGGGESDGTGDDRDKNKVAGKYQHKSKSKLPDPNPEYGANRSEMMDRMLAAAEKFKSSAKHRRSQL